MLWHHGRLPIQAKQQKLLKKRIKKIPESIKEAMEALHIDLEVEGPTTNSWPNYGKLESKKSKDLRHCHLQKGNPTYVACWEVVNKKEKK